MSAAGTATGRAEGDGREPFRAAPWLPGAHLQTLWSRLLRRGPIVSMRRETWDTPDGDVLELDFVDGSAGSPLLLALHGLEGCSRSLYMQGLLHQARSRGWRGVALNFRSCAPPPETGPAGAEGATRTAAGRGTARAPVPPRWVRREYRMNRGPRMYHSGETSDLDWVVGRLIAREPDVAVLLAGVSLGGNVLLKWLGERGRSAPPAVRAAATISVPYDLAAAARHLESGFGPVYMRYFLESLREKALRFDERYPGLVDVDGAVRARTFREIDEAATARIHGFEGADDYYARSSSIEFVDRIEVPTLLVSAADDPFMPGDVLPEVRRRAAPSVECEFTPRGGHAGFVVGPPWAPRYWAEERALAFLAARGGASHAACDPPGPARRAMGTR